MAFVVFVWIVGALFGITIAEISPVGTECQTVYLPVVTIVARLKVDGEQVSVHVLERQVRVVVLSRREFQCHSVPLGKSIKMWNEDNFDDF